MHIFQTIEKFTVIVNVLQKQMDVWQTEGVSSHWYIYVLGSFSHVRACIVKTSKALKLRGMYVYIYTSFTLFTQVTTAWALMG